MLELGLLTLCLLLAGALWFVLIKLRAAEKRIGDAERATARIRAGSENARRVPEPDARVELSGAAASGVEEIHESAAMQEAGREGPHSSDESRNGEGREEGRDDTPAINDEGTAVSPFVESLQTETPQLSDDAHAIAFGLEEFFDRTTHPRELLPNVDFQRGVELLAGGVKTASELVAHCAGSPPALTCMALEALARRAPDESGDTAERILAVINDCRHWPCFFALRALDTHSRSPVIGRLLPRLNSPWSDWVTLSSLREFIAGRAATDKPTLEEIIAEVERRRLDAEQISDLGRLLLDLSDTLPSSLATEFTEWREHREMIEFLKSFGRVWEAGGEDDLFVTAPFEARIAEIEAALKHEPPRSVLLVGESGTGKTATLRALAARLRAEHWIVFEAGAADVMSGQQYIGMIEGRLHTLTRQVADHRVLWVVPNFQEMLWAGRHTQSPTGVLDMILPDIESGKLKIAGEVQPAPYEQLVRMRPKLRTGLQTCRLSPLNEEETIELARRWAARHAKPHHEDGATRKTSDGASSVNTIISETTLDEAHQLARQYLGDKAAPGNLLLLLEATRRRLAAEVREGEQLALDDLLVTLSQVTGLPRRILDEREGLDLAELRSFFEHRVLGQPEAVECLVERVAMVKAGLTDPTRPQGVFLFVGPTGTGKTEIAKTLAEFLFGSPERMIRLDMSEFQTPDSLDRILGESGEMSDSAALVNQIRKQPFSVVLLDEFEKAHAQVWDLFLQVFDDGRLTDKRGTTADFRHSVIIMTSNLGATIPHGASIGFSQEQAQFAAASVERAVSRAFRREFVNRIDRVVVFRPLGRAVMRDLLRKELNDVLHRRGLRTRQWAVEWDESAIEFLLEKGFTADLGARPLKRAVERYLLSPLALAIVNHQYPEGDQFLFVRSARDGAALDVEFVDPDAPAPGEMPQPAIAPDELEEATAVAPAELSLESIALDAHGTPEEFALLRAKYEELAALANSEEWRARKEEALRQTQSSDFWNSAARFTVLGLIEYMDRIEAGLDTAGSLLSRLNRAGSAERRPRLPQDLAARLAQQLYLLDAARRGLADDEPRDAFLAVTASDEPGEDRDAGSRFARRLVRMYRRWAEKRRMRFHLLEERGAEASFDDERARSGDGADAARSYRALIAVSGYAAFTILEMEDGLHVLESPHGEKSFTRARARVRVVGQPDEPAGHGPAALIRQAEQSLSAEDVGTPQVVRRYREEPSPLVRDSNRGWRTGRLDRVLEGDFDLIS